MKTIILAGGEGRRLRPYTAVLPKPLMPLGERPILDHLLGQLRRQGFSDVLLSVGYLASLIEAYCGDGERFGVSLGYLREDSPLGTAGPIRLLQPEGEPFLVLNGDVLTDLDLNALVRFHQDNGQLLTVASYLKEVRIHLGVLELDEEGRITDYIEKPLLHHPVSMGVYCCSPEIVEFVPRARRFDLPDLVNALLASGRPVRAYQHRGCWLDIGRHEDYEQAVNEYERILGEA